MPIFWSLVRIIVMEHNRVSPNLCSPAAPRRGRVRAPPACFLLLSKLRTAHLGTGQVMLVAGRQGGSSLKPTSLQSLPAVSSGQPGRAIFLSPSPPLSLSVLSCQLLPLAGHYCKRKRNCKTPLSHKGKLIHTKAVYVF